MSRTGVTAPMGFSAAGVACGLKKNGNADLAFVLSEVPAACAGIFTRNVVKGHSLKWSKNNISKGIARAVVINSGCANACVGPDGDRDAREMAEKVASLIGCDPTQVFLGSTGVIGYRLDMDKITDGIHKAYAALSPEGGRSAAQAIMTTDTFCKEAAETLVLDGHTITIGGMAKGSGMIHPNMATMISVITTDAAITSQMLDKALRMAADKSYNRISVDGDTSVCDKVLLLANGKAQNPVIDGEGPAFDAFYAALLKVCQALAKMLAKDGEGATKLVEVRIKHASDRESAHMILNAIAKSPLVKTAVFGQDANMGRVFTAAGYSGAMFDPDKVDIWLGDLLVYQNGIGLRFDEDAALEILQKDEIIITLDMKDGDVEDHIWTCDMTYDYIKINGSYRT